MFHQISTQAFIQAWNTGGTDRLCLNKSAGPVIAVTEKQIHLCSLPTGNDTKKHKNVQKTPDNGVKMSLG